MTVEFMISHLWQSSCFVLLGPEWRLGVTLIYDTGMMQPMPGGAGRAVFKCCSLAVHPQARTHRRSDDGYIREIFDQSPNCQEDQLGQ
jgi:hypothetical protein